MELNINSPAYYTNIYGVDDEIYWMCRELAQYLKNKEYSEFIKIIGIVPIVAPIDVIEKGLCIETKKVELKCGFASVSLQIDYKKYVDADIIIKKGMIIDNILKSVKAIKSRAKIDYKTFEEDVRLFCHNNNIIFEIDKFEKLIFEKSIEINNNIALENYDLLLKKGYLRNFSKNDIISTLKKYDVVVSVIDTNNYDGSFTYHIQYENVIQSELDLIVDGNISGLILSCEFKINNGEIISGLINDIGVL